MLDKVVLQIPFSNKWVSSNATDFELNIPDPFSRDFSCSIPPEYIPIQMGAKTIDYVDGKLEAHDLYCPWESIASSHSGLAVKTYHTGNGYCKWPYIELKCSPAKLIQGHNIFGFDDLKKSISNMLWLLNSKYPEFLGGHQILDHLGPMLDLHNARVSELDFTYSLNIPDKKLRYAVLDFIRNISQGHTKPSGDSYQTTAYFGSKNSRIKRVKVYDKEPEVEKDTKDRARRRHNAVDKEILKLSKGLLRFEATAKREWFERRAIDTNLTTICNWFSEDQKRYMAVFADITKDLFTALEGQEVEIMLDDEIYQNIENHVGTTRGKAARVFATYQSIKAVGLDRFKKQHNERTFRRLVKELKDCGFSKAQICNLNANTPILVQVPKIVNLGGLFEPVPANHVFVDLWDQVAA